MKNIKRAAAILLSGVLLASGVVPTMAEESDITVKEVYNATFDSFTSGTEAYDKFDGGLLKIGNWENSVPDYADAAYFADNPAENADAEDVVVRGLCRKNTYFSIIFNADKKEVKEELQNAEKLCLTTDVYFDDDFDKRVDLSWWTTPFNEQKGLIGMFQFDFAKKEIRANGQSVYSGEIRSKWHTVGLLVDNTTKQVSYFFDNVPVAGAQNIKNSWNGTLNGMGRFLYAQLNGQTKDCYMYFNSVAASKSITVNFDRLLQPWAEIILSDAAGENIPLKTEFTDKSVILKPQQKLETNEEYTISIRGLSDKFGNILQQSPISFRTKIISVNIKDGEKYGYGKKLLWEENGKNVVTAKIIGEDGKEENAENGYTFTQTGAYEVVLSADNGAEVEKFKITILEAFAPVASDFWGAGFIAEALERGFIEKAQMFRPNDAIKREEAAKLISLITQDMPRESNEISFADSEKISAWAVDYIKDCAQKGLIKGDNGGNVNPQSKMTRAEAVTVIWRIIQNENTK